MKEKGLFLRLSKPLRVLRAFAVKPAVPPNTFGITAPIGTIPEPLTVSDTNNYGGFYMGGKRPDQYNIEPAEAGATDTKNLPQTGLGNSDLDDTIQLDQQKKAESTAELSHTPAPGRKPAPSQDANRALKADQAEKKLSDEPGAADADSRKENPLV